MTPTMNSMTAKHTTEVAPSNPVANFAIDESSIVPIGVQIRKRLVFLITSGKFECGAKLPSVRELSIQIGVNYNTVNKVYQGLERDGYIFTKRGLGTYVSDLKRVMLPKTDEEVSALAAELVERSLAQGMTVSDIYDVIDQQLLLAGR